MAKQVKNLIIVGAGGFGREILSWLPEVKGYSDEWKIGGYIDDNSKVLTTYNYNIPIVGNIQDYQPQNDDIFVMGIAAPTQKKLEIADKLTQKGAEFISLIHPSVSIGNNVSLGEGCVICRNTVFTCDIIVNDFVTVNILSVIGHDVVIENGCTLHPFANISGFVHLERCVEIGSHGCVLPNVRVGESSKIGAGSLVVNSVKPNTTVIGVPAKKLLG